MREGVWRIKTFLLVLTIRHKCDREGLLARCTGRIINKRREELLAPLEGLVGIALQYPFGAVLRDIVDASEEERCCLQPANRVVAIGFGTVIVSARQQTLSGKMLADLVCVVRLFTQQVW